MGKMNERFSIEIYPMGGNICTGVGASWSYKLYDTKLHMHILAGIGNFWDTKEQAEKESQLTIKKYLDGKI